MGIINNKNKAVNQSFADSLIYGDLKIAQDILRLHCPLKEVDWSSMDMFQNIFINKNAESRLSCLELLLDKYVEECKVGGIDVDVLIDRISYAFKTAVIKRDKLLFDKLVVKYCYNDPCGLFKKEKDPLVEKLLSLCFFIASPRDTISSMPINPNPVDQIKSMEIFLVDLLRFLFSREGLWESKIALLLSCDKNSDPYKVFVDKAGGDNFFVELGLKLIGLKSDVGNNAYRMVNDFLKSKVNASLVDEHFNLYFLEVILTNWSLGKKGSESLICLFVNLLEKDGLDRAIYLARNELRSESDVNFVASLLENKKLHFDLKENLKHGVSYKSNKL